MEKDEGSEASSTHVTAGEGRCTGCFRGSTKEREREGEFRQYRDRARGWTPGKSDLDYGQGHLSDAFAKLRNATVGFLCPSVCPHGQIFIKLL
jgi:hypothetical protein